MTPQQHALMTALIANGTQCPECYGVRVTTHKDRWAPDCSRHDRFTCEECGAQWSRHA